LSESTVSPFRMLLLRIRSLALSAYLLGDGMAVTLRYMFTKPVTLQYPHEMKKLPERTRGTLILYADIERMKCKCTVCMVCEVVCPNNSIHIDFERDTVNKKKVLTKYYWDADKCIYCGLCVEGCGFDALGWVPEFEISTTDRRKLVWDEKDMMQAWLTSIGRKDIDAKRVDNKWY